MKDRMKKYLLSTVNFKTIMKRVWLRVPAADLRGTNQRLLTEAASFLSFFYPPVGLPGVIGFTPVKSCLCCNPQLSFTHLQGCPLLLTCP